MSNIDEQSDPSESYVAPPRIFQGKELKPYSLGNKMLLAMITREGDPNSFFLFSLLYVLTESREKVQKDCADKDGVRGKILEWMDGLQLKPGRGMSPLECKEKGLPPDPNYRQGEEADAQDLAIAILQEANKEKVDPIAAAASGNG